VQSPGPFINLPILQPTVNFLRGQELGLLGKGLETRPGSYPIKYFTAVFYEFVPVKPFQPSLMFVGKARACLSEAPFMCSTLG
jgi:hypothetical protein